MERWLLTRRTDPIVERYRDSPPIYPKCIECGGVTAMVYILSLPPDWTPIAWMPERHVYAR